MGMIKDLIKNKRVMMGLGTGLGVLILVIIAFFIVNAKMITKLEKIKIEEKSSEVSDYFSEITENKDDEGKYINFAIEYLYNTKDKEAFSFDEVKEAVNSNFNLNYTDQTLNDIGITPSMQGKGIVYDNSTGKYKYSNTRTIQDIANDKIYYFKIDKIKKVNKNKFKVIYNEYVVENPYDILNYYNDYNIKNYEDKDKQYDTSKITNYLKGNEKVGEVKKIIREEKDKIFGSKKGKITVTYVIKDKKLLIDKIV